MRMAGLKVQSAIRMYAKRAQFFRLKDAAQTFQSAWRARQAGLAQRRQYLEMKTAAIQIQAVTRMHQARSSFLELKGAAITLQKIWHGRQDRIVAEQMASARTILAWYRARRDSRKYNQLRA